MFDVEAAGKKALPQIDGTVIIKGIGKKVTVYRDRWGVPHIFADNAADMFFAQGYVTAQDRLWQMETRRRAGAGRLSEIWGEVTLRVDHSARVLGLRQQAAAAAEALDEEYRLYFEAYVAGVNHFIETHLDRLPLEFHILGFEPDPYTVVDALTGGGAPTLAANGARELLRARFIGEFGVKLTEKLIPTDPPEPIQVPAELDYSLFDARGLVSAAALQGKLPPPLGDSGSNNWAVAGKKSVTGFPIVCNDPHLALSHPSVWYEIHMSGGPFDMYGVSGPPGPGLFVGHNRHMAWGVTVSAADVCDIFVEKTRENEYLSGDRWVPLAVRRETISVKGRSVPAQLDVRSTHHGPIIHVDPNTGMAFTVCSVPWAPSWGTQCMLELNKAKSCAEVTEILERWPSSLSQNFVYGDVDGNISHQVAGKMPDRRKGNGLVPVPGWTSEYDWNGYQPYDHNPAFHNPEKGWVASANHCTVPEGWPHRIGHDFTPPFRINRIVERLTEKDKLSSEDLQDMHKDVLSLPAREIVPHIRAVVAEDSEAKLAQDLLKDWDYRLEAASASAAVYEVFTRKMLRNTFFHRLGEKAYKDYEGLSTVNILALIDLLHRPEVEWFGPESGSAEAKRDNAIMLSLREAVRDLKEMLGSDPSGWRWGRLHLARWNHRMSDLGDYGELFDFGPVEMPGDAYTVRNSGYNPGMASYRQVGSQSCRLIMDLGDLRNSLAGGVSGQSGQPYSKHFKDLVSEYEQGEYHPMLYDRKDVEAGAEATLILSPQSD